MEKLLYRKKQTAISRSIKIKHYPLIQKATKAPHKFFKLKLIYFKVINS